MSGRPGKQPGPLRYAGDPETRGGFRPYLIEFTDWMGAMHYSAHTVKNRRIELGYFIDWCEERSITRPDEVTRALLERYRQHVFHYRRKDNGTPLSFQTQHKRLISRADVLPVAHAPVSPAVQSGLGAGAAAHRAAAAAARAQCRRGRAGHQRDRDR